MVERIVVDASIIAKWFLEEKDSQQALTIHDQYINGKLEIHVPDLLMYEVLNALLYSKSFSHAELSEATNALMNYGLISHPLRSNLAVQTTKIAFDTKTSIYDASYVALGQDIGCKVYTADIKILRKIKVAIKNVEIFALQDFKTDL